MGTLSASLLVLIGILLVGCALICLLGIAVLCVLCLVWPIVRVATNMAVVASVRGTVSLFTELRHSFRALLARRRREAVVREECWRTVARRRDAASRIDSIFAKANADMERISARDGSGIDLLSSRRW
jgi:hypothetical protein